MNEGKNKEIILNGRCVAYCLKISTRAKNLRITIKPGGVVLAVMPRGFSEKFCENFLIKKSRWVLGRINQLQHRQEFLSGGTAADFKNYVTVARQLVLKKIEKFNRIYQVKFNRVAIRNQRTRWGSCSRKGNLNFNYRIVLLPDRLSDYIVAHELCHLRELNHSRRFWDLVAVTLPDYIARRKELKGL